MTTTITTIINGQRVEVEVSASEILHVANLIDQELHQQTQNLIVFAADAYDWSNGHTSPSVGIRKVDKVGGPETSAKVGDINWLIAGTLRRIDNDREIVRIGDLMKLGYENAYVELNGQSACCGTLARPMLGKRKIADMQIVGDRAYLTLVPIEEKRSRGCVFVFNHER
jgi:hypothetical protein